MAPVLSFTAEESFRYIPEALKPKVDTVFAMPHSEIESFILDTNVRENWEKLLEIRAEITKAIEPIRKSGEIGHSLDTRIELYLNDNYASALKNQATDFRSVCIVSQLIVKDIKEAPVDAVFSDTDGIAIVVSKAHGEKCERCWIYSDELGTHSDHATLCPRCTKVMQQLDN